MTVVSAEFVTAAPHPALAGEVIRYTGTRSGRAAPVTFRELPCTYVPVIIDMDAGWSIADGRRPERPPERLGSFVAGLDRRPGDRRATAGRRAACRLTWRRSRPGGSSACR